MTARKQNVKAPAVPAMLVIWNVVACGVLPRVGIALLATLFNPTHVQAQAGLRQALENLDRNENGKIEPDEITPLARTYLERITGARRMSLAEANDIDQLQEAAPIYHALKNGVTGRDVRPKVLTNVRPFGPDPGQPLVPEFGIGKMKYRYTQADLDEADRTIQRYDTNRDGYIDRAEAAVSRWTHRNPFEMDYNRDHRLDRLELTQRYARRRLLKSASGELVKKARRVGNGIIPSSKIQQGKDDSQWRRDSRSYLALTILGRFDKNRNGKLDADETDGLGLPLARIDLDADGELSRAELQSYTMSIQDSDSQDSLPEWFFKRDANEDNQVSMSEFSSEWTEEQLATFQAHDLNRDGLLTGAEVLRSKQLAQGVYSNSTAEALPPRRTIISEIEVVEDYLIGDINVRISISHTHSSYLDAYLTGPGGQRIELFTEVGGSGDNFADTVFDDQARDSITRARSPFRGSFQPEALVKKQPGLSHFNGKNVHGVWQLVIRGTKNDRFGMLHGWSIIAQPTDSLTNPSPVQSKSDPSIPNSDADTSTKDPQRQPSQLLPIPYPRR